MANRVNVTSVEAIEAFRASLIVYITKARPTLEEVNAEIVRLRIWVQTTQRTEWEAHFKKRYRILEEAKAALFRSRLSNLSEVSAAEIQAVNKAQRAVNEAEDKLRMLRKWDRDFENQTEPIARQLEKLQTFLADDLGKAVIYLSQTLASLHAYAGIVAPSLADASGESKPPATNTSGDSEGSKGGKP
jgi:hypothetical protein